MWLQEHCGYPFQCGEFPGGVTPELLQSQLVGVLKHPSPLLMQCFSEFRVSRHHGHLCLQISSQRPITIVTGAYKCGNWPFLASWIKPHPFPVEGPTRSRIFPIPHSLFAPRSDDTLEELSRKVVVHRRNMPGNTPRTVEAICLEQRENDDLEKRTARFHNHFTCGDAAKTSHLPSVSRRALE